MTDPFHTLLNDPPGTYGLTPNGNTSAVTLRGDARFRELGYNLFTSYGGETLSGARCERPLPPIHLTEDKDVVWFCLPASRVRVALTLYLYGQLYQTQGVRRSVIDDEGDLVEVVCDNEDALYEQAGQLACDFVVNHMHPDYATVDPEDQRSKVVVEHGMGTHGHDGDWA